MVMRICAGAGALILGIGLVSCRTLDVEAIRSMAEQGEIDRLHETWREVESDELRSAVLEAFSRFSGDAEGRKIVLETARMGRSEKLRMSALEASQSYEGEDAVLATIEALGDPSPAVREIAQRALHDRRAAAETALVDGLVHHRNPLVRASSAKLLGQGTSGAGGDEGPVDDALLLALKRDDAPEVRSACASSLGQRMTVRARPALREALRLDSDDGVRMAAERAIAKLGTRDEVVAVVAVLPLKNDTGLGDPEIDRMRTTVSEYVAARLAQSERCRVVDRDKMDHAIAELRKTGKPIYDGDVPNVPEIGKFQIANQLVYGSIQRQGSVFTLVLNRMDVSTLTIVPGGSATAAGYRSELDRLKVDVTERLMEGFR